MSVEDEVAGARAATAGLLEHLDGLDDLTAPSLLPGWSRAHVVAHLAGNARSHVRMLDGCLAGEVVAQYPGAEQGRAAEIEALAADRGAVVAAHREACAELDARWTAMSPEHWEHHVQRLDITPKPARGLVWSRWREVEVHRVDLGAGHTPADWDGGFADRLLTGLLARPDLPPMVVATPDAERRVGRGAGPRVSGSTATLAAWLMGRDGGPLEVAGGALPGIPAWT
ncbi:MAG: maleylpyruvate isomerase family mycothiol-dependent enzyme [Actinobacteria bacterium]|nr:maleylpyruvate isomerase family mycothiol-dependent enzyme [Actinomycetota bacterium]